MSYADMVLATVPAAPPTWKNQRATSWPARLRGRGAGGNRPPLHLEAVAREPASERQRKGNGGGLDAGKRLDLVQDPARRRVSAKIHGLALGDVLWSSQQARRETEGQDVTRVESGFVGDEGMQAANQQTGARQEDERERHLRRDESCRSPAAPASLGDGPR